MPWTEEEQLRYLCRLPWTIIAETTPEGDHLLRANEVPAAVGRGQTSDALLADFWRALRETLAVYLRSGGEFPLPATVRDLPWQDRCSGPPDTTTFSTATINILRIVPAPGGE